MSSDRLPSAAILSACPGGDPGWLAGETLLRLVWAEPDGTADSWQTLGVWVAAFVMKEVPGYTAAVARWTQTLRGQDPEATTQNMWNRLAVAVGATQPPPTIGITNRRYLTVSGVPVIFDLEAGTATDTIPSDWLESRVFNLRTLYRACLAKAKKWTPPRPPSGPTPTPPSSAS